MMKHRVCSVVLQLWFPREPLLSERLMTQQPSVNNEKRTRGLVWCFSRYAAVYVEITHVEMEVRA